MGLCKMPAYLSWRRRTMLLRLHELRVPQCAWCWATIFLKLGLSFKRGQGSFKGRRAACARELLSSRSRLGFFI
eukprot:5336304-Pleurochrysis_carterae.AAC.2